MPERVEEIQAAHPGQRIEVWFQDEARIGQQGTMTRQWGIRGERLTVPLQTGYEWVYLIGATCPQTGNSLALALPQANTEMMNRFLKKLAAAMNLDTHLILVWDGAAWHRSKTLVIPKNISLVSLPPYSPELNPVERIWRYLRSHFLSNRLFKNYHAILEAVCDAWNQFTLDPQRVASVTSVSWLLAYN
ncbi:MAG: IS630 family transposase [Candidatus Omnitrophota bacterium]